MSRWIALFAVFSSLVLSACGAIEISVLSKPSELVVDESQPSISVADLSVSEGASFSFLVSLSFASTDIVTLDYATQDGGGALAGTHYTAVSGTLTFSPGETSKTIVVATNSIPSTVCSADRTMRLTLSNPGNARIVDAIAIGTITDPHLPTLSLASASAIEGADVTFVATLSQACAARAVSFEWSTHDGSATAPADYGAVVSNLVVIPPGSTTVELDVATVDDLLDEVDKSFSVSIAPSSDFDVGGSTLVATGTILDDDAPPTVSWTLATSQAYESSISANVQLQLSGPSERAIEVPFTQSGTASIGVDYTLTASPVTIPAGSTTVNVEITLNDDATVEPAETVVLSIGTPTHATVGSQATHTFTIQNDDIGPFSISGIQSRLGSPDSTTDAYLNGAATPRILFGAASGADLYSVTIYESNGTTVRCGTRNILNPPFDYPAVDCSLTPGASYQLVVRARIGSIVTSDATNSPYTFTYNRPPVVTPENLKLNYTDSALTLDPLANDSDPDGDTLTITALGNHSPVNGTLSFTASSITYEPNGNIGHSNFSYTVSDGRGGSAVGWIAVYTYSPFTFTGESLATPKVWSDGANWCGVVVNSGFSGACPGGAPPSDKLDPTHIAYINNNASAPELEITSAVEAYGIRVSGQPTLRQMPGTGNVIAIGNGGLSISFGNFQGGNADMVVTTNSNTPNIQNESGVFQATSAATILERSGASGSRIFDVDATSSWNPNGGTFYFRGDASGSPVYRIRAASSSHGHMFNHAYFQSTGGATSAERVKFEVETGGTDRWYGNFRIGRAGGAGTVSVGGVGGAFRPLYVANAYATAGARGGSVVLANDSVGFYDSSDDGILPILSAANTPSSRWNPLCLYCRVSGVWTQIGVFNAPVGGVLEVFGGASSWTGLIRIDVPGGLEHNQAVFAMRADPEWSGNGQWSLTSTLSGTRLNIPYLEFDGSNIASGRSYAIAADLDVSTSLYFFRPSGAGFMTGNYTNSVIRVSGDVMFDGTAPANVNDIGGSVVMTGSDNQNLWFDHGARMPLHYRVDKTGGVVTQAGNMLLDTWGLSFDLINGVHNADGFSITVSDGPGGFVNTLNLEAGTILDMNGGTLVYENLTGTGTIEP